MVGNELKIGLKSKREIKSDKKKGGDGEEKGCKAKSEELIGLGHGAGGSLMQSLIKEVILKHLSVEDRRIKVGLKDLDDSAVIEDIVLTTDSHTVKPLFFPGGDIGVLAVAGTVNDLAVIGAEPLALTCGLIIEEGFSIDDFEKIMRSIGETSNRAGVPVITGDTKVVERGAADKLYVNTSGIGKRHPELDRNLNKVREYRELKHDWLVDSNVAPGDKIIVSGTIGDHGIALMSFREGLRFETSLKSDVAPLNKMIERVLKVGGITAMKDATRGGLANALNEWSEKSHVSIWLEEEKIPIRHEVNTACSMLGLDPMQIGNEGKIVISCIAEYAERIVKELRACEEGKDAAIIGEVKEGEEVIMVTKVGGKRFVEPPIGDPVPRIC